MTTPPYKVSFVFGKNYYDGDYDRTACTGNCDDYCRCSRIVNFRIGKIDPVAYEWVSIREVPSEGVKGRNKEYRQSIMDRYCIDRLVRIHKMYDPGSYSADIAGGYYGEEFIGIAHDNEKPFIDDVSILVNSGFTDLEKLKWILAKEYSYLLNEVEEASTLEVQTLTINDIRRQNEYFSRIKREVDGYTYLDWVPIGVVYNGTRLIDGYHRTANWGKDTADYFVIS